MNQLTIWWSRVTRVNWQHIPGMACLLLVHGVPVASQDSKTAQPAMEDQATQAMKRMADFLSKAQRVNTTVEIGFDVVQDSGQKIEFGETRKITIRRPDHVRIETTKRDGAVKIGRASCRERV